MNQENMTRLAFKTDLVLHAMEGQPRAMEDLLRACAPLVLGTCRRFANTGVDPDDAAQDAMVAIIEGLPRLRDPATFGAWCACIARRKAVRAGWRAWFRKRSVFTDRLLPANDNTPEDTLIRRQRTDHLQRCLALLPEKEAIVARGVYLEEHSCRQVAREQGWNEATTRRRKQRAQIRLRALLASSEAPPRNEEGGT